MEACCELSKCSSSAPMDARIYRNIIWSLRYLVHTRPGIAYDVGFLNRIMVVPMEEHLAAVEHLLRYISGTHTHVAFIGAATTSG